MNELTLKIRSLIDRITLNKLTATFFLFGFFHCFAQGIIQSLLFSADYTYYSFINDIIAAGDVPAANHTFFVGQTLRTCDYLPHDDTTCEEVYTLGESQDMVANVVSTRAMNRRDIHDGVKITSSDIVAFPVSLEMKDSQTVQLSEMCISTLLFPHQDLENSRRENLAFIFMQFWLFGISVLAMIYDSVPHIMAGIGARILLTAWSAYSIWRTIHQEGVYASLLSDPGTPCSMDFFPNYFGRRTALEIPDLVLNCTALIIMVWTLLRVYAVQSYKCLGAPNHILSMQKLYMALQACLHLEVYILLAGMGLWIDQLFNTYINDISTNTKVYEGVFIFYTILVVPWTGLGWYTIRYEKRRLMYIFLGIGFLFLFAACMMFYSQVFRWTFFMWPNLGCYTVAYMILMVACITLGVVCLRNFGKGLAQYLHAESVLEKSHFAPEVFDVEKGGREEVRREVHEEQEQPVPLHSVQAPFKAGDFEDRPISTYYLPTLHVSDTGPGGVVAVKRA